MAEDSQLQKVQLSQGLLRERDEAGALDYLMTFEDDQRYHPEVRRLATHWADSIEQGESSYTGWSSVRTHAQQILQSGGTARAPSPIQETMMGRMHELRRRG